MAEPEAEGWLGLGCVSKVFGSGTEGFPLTHQSIESASMIIEANEEPYDGHGEKHKHCSQNVTCSQRLHELHVVGCMMCSANVT